MARSGLELADVHLDLLYERDEAGLLLRSRDPEVRAPLLHLVRTTEGNRWRLAAALSDEQRRVIEDALIAEPVLRDLSEMEGRAPILAGVRQMLGRELGQGEEGRGPAFWFGESPRIADGSSEIVEGGPGVRTVPELAWVSSATPAMQPLSVVRNSSGEVVAVCHSARSTPMAAEAGVETAQEYRGRGFAGAAVLGWAAAVQAEGRLPVYSTRWVNQASRSVARKLGLIMFGEDVAFE